MVNIADQYDAGDQRTSGDDDAAECRIWYISPKEPHNKTAYFVDAPYQVDKISDRRSLTGRKKQAIHCALFAGAQPLYSG